MKRIISLSGNIASGKTEVATEISKLLNMKMYTASDAFRELARENNMSIVEFNEYIKDKSEYDKLVEEKTKMFSKNNDNAIVDARLGFFVIPDSFKVCLRIDIDLAAKRLHEECTKRGKEERYSSFDEAKSAILLRESQEKQRYIATYGVDITDDKNYDLIVDTSGRKIEEIANYITKKYKEWLKEG